MVSALKNIHAKTVITKVVKIDINSFIDGNKLPSATISVCCVLLVFLFSCVPILGDHLDGFHNKVTALAVANPSPQRGGDKLTTRAAGFGVVNINKETRNITFTCWPRNIDITDEKAKPYKGWPFTFNQLDNYGRKAVSHLPTLKINKPNQVVQLINERNNEIVYTIRVKGSSFKPKVFENGTYTIKVGEKKNKKTLKSIGTDSKKEYIIIKI